MYETVCGHCPLRGGCRYRIGGVSAAEIAYWAVYRRDASRLMRLYPDLGVEDIRSAVEQYARCPAHKGESPGVPLLAVA